MDLLRGYLLAYAKVIEAGYRSDIEWAESLALVKPDALYVMSETAWVILNSGFRYSVARKMWPGLTAAFSNWDVQLIGETSLQAGLQVFNHPKKLGAMVEVARLIREQGFEGIVQDAVDPPKLTRLPWIGHITCWHLAKVMGADVVKPDVHLKRAAEAAGQASPLALCEAIRAEMRSCIVSSERESDFVDRRAVIDSVLWRYGEQQKARSWPSWEELFGAGSA